MKQDASSFIQDKLTKDDIVLAEFIDEKCYCIYFIKGDTTPNLGVSEQTNRFCKYDLLKNQITLDLTSRGSNIICQNKKDTVFPGTFQSNSKLLSDSIHILLQGDNGSPISYTGPIVLFNTIDSTYTYITNGYFDTDDSNQLMIYHGGYFEEGGRYEILEYYDLDGNCLGNDGYVYYLGHEEKMGGMEWLDPKFREQKRKEEELEQLKKSAIPIEQICDEFRNEVKASKLYKGKRIIIMCKISELESAGYYEDCKYILKSYYNIWTGGYNLTAYTNDDNFTERTYPATVIIQGVCLGGGIRELTLNDYNLLAW